MQVEFATPEVGAQIEGGTYAGAIHINGQIYGVIVAPKHKGETTSVWGPRGLHVPGATSFFDGAANTQAMAAAGCSVAQWALDLRIGEHSDWHIPARDELELIYRNLKPTAEENTNWRGDNPSSDPVGYPYADTVPGQTAVASFREGGTDAMADEWYWSSTQYSAHGAWGQYFDYGDQNFLDKGYEARVRAVRRFLID